MRSKLTTLVLTQGVDEPLASCDGAGTAGRRYYHADEGGSVIARSDGEANGVTLDTTGYDEYGASNLTYRFRFTGQMWVPELGPALVHYRARFYHNSGGRFLQPDPIGYGSGMNLYAYVRGDPVNLTDSVRLQRWTSACQGGRWIRHGLAN